MKTYYLSKVSDEEKQLCAPQLQTPSKQKALEWLNTYATEKAAYAVWRWNEGVTKQEIVAEAGGANLRYLVFSGLTRPANDSSAKDVQSYWLPPATDRAEFEAKKREQLAPRTTKNTTVYWSSSAA